MTTSVLSRFDDLALQRTERGIAYVHRPAVDDSALPVLLVHGHFGSHASLWTATLPALGGRAVAAFDQPWHGASIPRMLENESVVVDALFSVLDELGWQRCIAIGHGEGAHALLAARARCPERFAQQVLIALHGDPDHDERATYQRLSEHVDFVGVEAIVEMFASARWSAAWLQQTPTATTHLRRDLEEIGANNVAAILRTWARSPPLLPLVGAGPPVVSLVATHDEVGWPAPAEALHAAAGAHVVVVDGSHCFFDEDPALLHAALRQHLSQA